jgi:serralysin
MVMRFARRWTEVSKGKVNFFFDRYDGTTNRPDLRVSFDTTKGSNSYIGSDALNVPKNKATMNFGWIPLQGGAGVDTIVIQEVVLHEFGHAIGLVHEHQSPGANIPWDTTALYEYYERTQDPPWTEEQVNSNILQRYAERDVDYNRYDVLSIMHYSIDNDLTIGDFETGWNTVLSVKDSMLVNRLYPYHPCVVNVDCCYDRAGRRVPCP